MMEQKKIKEDVFKVIESVIEFRKPTNLDEIINYTKKHLEDFSSAKDSYYVYSRSNKIDLYQTCYLDDGPEITDNYDEIYSDFVIENNLELILRSELISLVIESAIYQKENVSNEEIFKAINYYDEHDDFMDFE